MSSYRGKSLYGKQNSQIDEIKSIDERADNIGNLLRKYLRVEKSTLPSGKQMNQASHLLRDVLDLYGHEIDPSTWDTFKPADRFQLIKMSDYLGRSIEGNLNSQSDEIRSIYERSDNIGNLLRQYLRVEKSQLTSGKQINQVSHLLQNVLGLYGHEIDPPTQDTFQLGEQCPSKEPIEDSFKLDGDNTVQSIHDDCYSYMDKSGFCDDLLLNEDFRDQKDQVIDQLKMEIEDLRSAAVQPKVLNISSLDLHLLEAFISDLIDTNAPTGTFPPLMLTLNVDGEESWPTSPKFNSPGLCEDSELEFPSRLSINLPDLDLSNMSLSTPRASSPCLSIDAFNGKMYESEMQVLKIRQHMISTEQQKLKREKIAWARQRSKEMSILQRRNSTLSLNSTISQLDLTDIVEIENEIQTLHNIKDELQRDIDSLDQSQYYVKDIKSQMRHFDADVEIIRSTGCNKRAKMLVENLKNKLSNLKSQKTMHMSLNQSRRNSRRMTSIFGNPESRYSSRPSTPKMTISPLKPNFRISLGKVDETLEDADAQDTSASDRVRWPLKMR